MNPSIKNFLYLCAFAAFACATTCDAWVGFGGGWDGGWRSRPWGYGTPVYVEPGWGPGYYHHDSGSAIIAGIGGIAVGAALANANTPRTAAQEEDLARAQEISRERTQRADEARAERLKRRDEERDDRIARKRKRQDEDDARQEKRAADKAAKQQKLDDEKAAQEEERKAKRRKTS